MNDYNNKSIFFTLREYENEYNSLLKQYLDQHEDFDELMFLDIELEFYNLCFNNSNIIIVDYGNGPDYSLDGTLCYQILPKIYDTITTFLELNNGFDLELGIKYTATFSKIIKFLEYKRNKVIHEIDDLYIGSVNNTQSTLSLLDKDIVEADENNYIKSTIDDYLQELLEDIDTPNYNRLVNALYSYFSNSVFPTLSNKIIFKRVNKKKVGWALKEVYKNIKTESLDIEYLRFAQQNINIFENEIIVEEGFNKSKFYKVFTTNPAK